MSDSDRIRMLTVQAIVIARLLPVHAHILLSCSCQPPANVDWNVICDYDFGRLESLHLLLIPQSSSSMKASAFVC